MRGELFSIVVSDGFDAVSERQKHASGMIGNQNLVRVAVVHEPRAAIPLQGTWIGTASDHLAVEVAVKVVAT